MIAKMFDIIKYFKNEKNQILKKKNIKQGKFLNNPENKTKKMSIAKLNYVHSGWKDTSCHRRADTKFE